MMSMQCDPIESAKMRMVLRLECEQRREFEQLERDMLHESPETGDNWYDKRFGPLAYEMGVRHGEVMANQVKS